MINCNIRLKGSSPLATKIRNTILERVGSFCERKKLPHMLASIAVTHMNFLGMKIPTSIFERMNYANIAPWKDGKYGMKGDPTEPWAPWDETKLISWALNYVNGDTVCIPAVKREKIGRYTLQFNYPRSFKPAGKAEIKKKKEIKLEKPYEAYWDYNNFERMGYSEAVMFSEKIDGLKCDLTFNPFPFAPFHFLVIPSRLEGKHGQYLQQNNKDFPFFPLKQMWDLIQREGPNTPIRLGFNSMGAHASQPQLHFQGFLLTKSWEPPIEKVIASGARQKDFFLPSTRWFPKSSNTIAQVTALLGKLHDQDIRYNLYISPKGIAVFPRKSQNHKGYVNLLNKGRISGGLAFFEMLGEIICPDQKIFNALTKRTKVNKKGEIKQMTIGEAAKAERKAARKIEKLFRMAALEV